MHYIYRISHLKTGWSYIGQHKPKPGESFHRYYGSGKLISAALKEQGKKAFQKQILEYCSSQQQANHAERLHIALERLAGGAQYNIADGGQAIGSKALQNIWQNSELREQQSQKISKLWQNAEHRERLVQSQINHWAKTENRLAQSQRMEEKWRESGYSATQRAKLKDSEVLKRISNSESRTRMNNRRHYSRTYQKRWHLEKHLPMGDHRRTCYYCVKESLAESFSEEQLATMLNTGATRASKILSLERREVDRIKTLASKFQLATAAQLLEHIYGE